ncbi:MAG: LysR family transcriptional regulator [Mogibacterium sp.]|nr:LysR family transcriptional regulator [Mogibacterium sp.]
MDFKQIEAFVNVVRYKSFSKAADASFFTQPTISTHIQNLEKELGVKLLNRKSRSVEMTAQGATFFKFAVEMINARARAIDAISESSKNVEGILEIQTSSIPGVTFLPDYLSEFKETHKLIQYYVSLSDSQNVLENILDRRGEIGFVGELINNVAIESHLVFSDKSVLIAPKSYGLGDTISLEDSFKYPFIWRETGSATRRNFEEAAAKIGVDRNDIRFAALVDDLDALARTVEAGLGVSIISENVAQTLKGRVSVSSITNFDDSRSFYMIYLKNSSLSPAAAAFAKFVKSKSAE